MSQLLRKVTRGLRYRPLAELVGRRVQIGSAESIESDVKTMLGLTASKLQGPSERFSVLAVAKYVILDLTFAAKEFEWETDDHVGLRFLEEYGFVLRTEEMENLKRDFPQEDDPTCISTLEEQIVADKKTFRLFLEEEPRRDMRKHMLAIAESGGFEQFLTVKRDWFPRLFRVKDACLTNAEFVWFHKHFYM